MNKPEFYSLILGASLSASERAALAEHDAERNKKLRETQAQLAEAVGLLHEFSAAQEAKRQGVSNAQRAAGISRLVVAEERVVAFLARHVQSEQQEAKPVAVEAPGAQDVDERAAFEKWAKDRSWFDPRPSTKERDDSLFCYEEAITDHNWIAWQARAALATQPAGGEPIGKIVSFGPRLHEVAWSKGKLPPLGTELYTAPPAAAHGAGE